MPLRRSSAISMVWLKWSGIRRSYLDKYFPLPQKLQVLRRQATTNEKDADVVVSTAHRSKGLEWDTVILNDDFSDITNLLLSEEARTDETNLLYVATTLARKLLVRNALLKLLCEQEEPDDIAEELLSGFELFVVKAAQ